MGIHQFMDMVDTGTWIAAIGAYPEYLILGMNSYTQLSLLRTRIVYYFISEKKKRKKSLFFSPKAAKKSIIVDTKPMYELMLGLYKISQFTWNYLRKKWLKSYSSHVIALNIRILQKLSLATSLLKLLSLSLSLTLSLSRGGATLL